MSMRFDEDIENLLLDPDNPRLPDDLARDQSSILRYLTEYEQVDDLVTAMCASGFIPGDPVIVKEAEDLPGKFYVVEGNRRLAALMWLRGSRIEGFEGPQIGDFPAPIAATFSRIEVERDWPSEKLAAYLGYKHVTSAKEWSPEAKARFVIRQAGDLSDANLTKYANAFGSRLATLKRWLIAYKALEQARAGNLLTEEQLRADINFGTFYTLLGGEQVRAFIGLKAGEIVDNPVGNAAEFKEFLAWTIGTEDTLPKINSRQQKQLETVLANPDAKSYFRAEQDIRAALQYTGFRSDEVAGRLRASAYDVERTLPVLNDVKDAPAVIAGYQALRNAVRKVRINLELPEDV